MYRHKNVKEGDILGPFTMLENVTFLLALVCKVVAGCKPRKNHVWAPCNNVSVIPVLDSTGIVVRSADCGTWCEFVAMGPSHSIDALPTSLLLISKNGSHQQ